MTADLKSIETKLLGLSGGISNPNAIFIVGGPRTGSTFLYQAMASAFSLPFISNLTNSYLADTPIVGLTIQNGVQVPVGFESSFGKTKGLFQPSEGSAVLMNWFGGGHPSQIVSTGFIEGRQEHCLRTLAATETLCGGPLLTKNAWNCFRVPAIASVLPSAHFIWIRRDIRNAAASDLEARYRTKEDPNEWNSATPANFKDLQKRPLIEQVVENQFAFNTALSSTLRESARDHYLELWYEDITATPTEKLEEIGRFIGRKPDMKTTPLQVAESGRWSLEASEKASIEQYVARQFTRFEGHLNPKRSDLGRVGQPC